MASYSVTSDSELRTRVRALTGYEDTADELSHSDLDEIAAQAKQSIAVEYGTDTWYSDEGIGMALVGTTCIFAKAAIENYSVSSWSVGDQTIDVQGAGQTEQAQFEFWAGLTSTGVQNSSQSNSVAPTNTSDYIG